jgi:hypothetical protein
VPSVPTVTSSGGSTCVNVPVPLPVTVPTLNLGGVSVGVSSGGASSGANVCLP